MGSALNIVFVYLQRVGDHCENILIEKWEESLGVDGEVDIDVEQKINHLEELD